jgi:hypothetical protein
MLAIAGAGTIRRAQKAGSPGRLQDKLHVVKVVPGAD